MLSGKNFFNSTNCSDCTFVVSFAGITGRDDVSRKGWGFLSLGGWAGGSRLIWSSQDPEGGWSSSPINGKFCMTELLGGLRPV